MVFFLSSIIFDTPIFIRGRKSTKFVFLKKESWVCHQFMPPGGSMDLFCNFYLMKNHQTSTITEARGK
jgi:hypothetical protein